MKIHSAILLLALSLLAPPAALAGDDDDRPGRRGGDRGQDDSPSSGFLREDEKPSGNGLSKEKERNERGFHPGISRKQASRLASDRYEGRVLSVRLEDDDRNWRVRMVRRGMVFNVFVDAASGAVDDVNEAAEHEARE